MKYDYMGKYYLEKKYNFIKRKLHKEETDDRNKEIVRNHIESYYTKKDYREKD